MSGNGRTLFDAVAAASAQHVVLLENERVRLIDAQVEAGGTVPHNTGAGSTSDEFANPTGSAV